MKEKAASWHTPVTGPLSIDTWASLCFRSLERQLRRAPSMSFSLPACRSGCLGQGGLSLLLGRLRFLPSRKKVLITRFLSVVRVTAPPFSPCQAAQAPEVTYEADKGSMWTLLLTNLGRCLRLARPPSPPMSQGAGGRAR